MKIILYDTLVWLSKNKHLEIEFQKFHNFKSKDLELHSTVSGTKYFKYVL